MQIAYWKGLIVDAEIRAKCEKEIEQLLCHDYRSLDLERLNVPKTEIYSIRVNRAHRLVFTTYKQMLLILAFVPEHDYRKCAFLKKGRLKTHLQLNDDALAAIVNSGFKPDDGETLTKKMGKKREKDPHWAELEYHGHRWVELTPNQYEVVAATRLPIVVSGLAGAGKTTTALSIMLAEIQKPAEDGCPPILYVSKSDRLVGIRMREWREMVSEEENHRVVFLSYEALLKAHFGDEMGFVDKTAFSKWYSLNIIKSNKALPSLLEDTELAWDEVKTCAGFGFKTLDEYEALGERQSALPKGETRWHLFKTYLSYMDMLQREKVILPELFTPNEPMRQYPLVLVDEAQNLSLCEVNLLKNIALKNQIIFYIGEQQVITSRRPNLPYIRELYYKTVGIHIPEFSLPVSHRCPKRVITLVNEFTRLKRLAVGGTADKAEQDIMVAAEHAIEGDVVWCTPDEMRQNESIHLRAKTTDFAVITRPGYRDEAKTLFPEGVVVFTVDEVQGLDIPDPLAYKVIPQRVCEALAPFVESQATHKNRPKADKGDFKDSADFDAIITIMTRSEHSLTIVESNTSRAGIKLAEHLKKFIKPLSADDQKLSEAQEAPVAATADDWERKAAEYLLQKNDIQAQQIWFDILKRSPDEFEAFKEKELVKRHHQLAQKTMVSADKPPGMATTPTSKRKKKKTAAMELPEASLKAKKEALPAPIVSLEEDASNLFTTLKASEDAMLESAEHSMPIASNKMSLMSAEIEKPEKMELGVGASASEASSSSRKKKKKKASQQHLALETQINSQALDAVKELYENLSGTDIQMQKLALVELITHPQFIEYLFKTPVQQHRCLIDLIKEDEQLFNFFHAAITGVPRAIKPIFSYLNRNPQISGLFHCFIEKPSQMYKFGGLILSNPDLIKSISADILCFRLSKNHSTLFKLASDPIGQEILGIMFQGNNKIAPNISCDSLYRVNLDENTSPFFELTLSEKGISLLQTLFENTKLILGLTADILCQVLQREACSALFMLTLSEKRRAMLLLILQENPALCAKITYESMSSIPKDKVGKHGVSAWQNIVNAPDGKAIIQQFEEHNPSLVDQLKAHHDMENSSAVSIEPSSFIKSSSSVLDDQDNAQVLLSWARISAKGVCYMYELLRHSPCSDAQYNQKLKTWLIFAAAKHDCRDKIKWLSKDNAVFSNTMTKDDTPIHVAAKHNQAKIIAEFGLLGVRLDEFDSKDLTPAHIAAYWGHIEVIETLISWKANVNKVNSTGFKPIHFAAQNGHANIVHLLYSYTDASPGELNERIMPAILAACHGHLNVIKELHYLGADLNAAIHPLGLTPIYSAASAGKLDVVEYLIRTVGVQVDVPCGLDTNWATNIMKTNKDGIIDIHGNIDTQLSAFAAITASEKAQFLLPYDIALRGGHIETAEAIKSVPTSQDITDLLSKFGIFKDEPSNEKSNLPEASPTVPTAPNAKL